jgi:hypothetical protein
VRLPPEKSELNLPVGRVHGLKSKKSRTVDAERRSRNQMPRLELYAERGQQKMRQRLSRNR